MFFIFKTMKKCLLDLLKIMDRKASCQLKQVFSDYPK
eukprot:UN06045